MEYEVQNLLGYTADLTAWQYIPEDSELQGNV
jgi:hypothetical protein